MITYNEFRNNVLANTNGKNIHAVNGCLGIILNAGKNREYWNSKEDIKKITACNDIIEKEILNLREKGINIFLDTIDFT